MELQQRTKRFGWCIILCACILRLLTSGPFLSYLTYLETGRNVRFSASSPKALLHMRESPAPWMPEPEGIRFSQEDLSRVALDYDCLRQPDVASLLLQPLDWDLTAGDPAVLILHTHTTESYTPSGEDYPQTSAYRTLSEEHNMLRVGETVARVLTEAGIGVIHDRQIHDYPSYNGAYVHARASVQALLEQYPTVRLVLDLHRDALEQEGRQMRPVAAREGETAARLMLVMGTDVSRKEHTGWQENLALALKLHVRLEQRWPGIMRDLNLRAQRFNQDLSSGAVLVEVGAAGNTLPEALTAARELALAVADLAKGTEG